MDKSIILSVAGSGKTFYLINKTNLEEKFLIITYTNSGVSNLREEIINKYGYLPNNIRILNFFSFLYTFCYKPYLSDLFKDKGITWKRPYNHYDNSFLNKSNYLYGNRISKLINEKCIEEVKKRIEKYFNYVFIDEIQDFASSDFNFIINIISGSYNITLVGDFYQHTFDTSRDKNINKNLYKSTDNFMKYFERLGIKQDNSSLLKSRRCSKNVCEFIKQKLNIQIESQNEYDTKIKLINDDDEIDKVFSDNTIIKLFLTSHYKYKCYSNNWGNCKGLTYKNVCIIINDEILKQFDNQYFSFKSQITKNKFYVACSRTRGDLYFISDKKIKKYKN
ncbi:UvrD-helicase domain-containing protein [Elizabethkingia anophelis]|uniref:UvrD-helicase domain-containing protein n=1 Tax=Elizabethkingia anophelis TaxID=1117645 RepID=UPI00293C6BDD|nr:DNA helicase UvrD [Elizabethkingia anophelis]